MEIKLLRDDEKRRFFQTLPDLMMNDKTAVAVQYAAKIIKSAADIQVSSSDIVCFQLVRRS